MVKVDIFYFVCTAYEQIFIVIKYLSCVMWMDIMFKNLLSKSILDLQKYL